ncbi:MAG: HNH endonuclease [Dehalococcoidia bacterium]|nr:MAG: HNH endonuclease [Dehalococcoidia bacterium]
MLNNSVLVLSQSYEAINICLVRRALVLILNGKAEMIENGLGYIHSTNDIFPIPSVIKLAYIVRRPLYGKKLTRFGVFQRDRYTCQYCANISHQLTIDHVLPRNQGGKQSWENVVSACVSCNRRKAGRTPKQANMRLIRMPCRPRNSLPFNIPRQYLENLGDWHKYLFLD